MWHRTLRMLAFWAGFLSCGLIALFLYFNTTSVTLHFWRWDFEDVSLGLVALVPLAAGVATGYLYHMPARMHHLSEHMRHRKRVHELEKEIEQLKKGMDQLLEMPTGTRTAVAIDAKPAVRALEAPKNGEILDAVVEPVPAKRPVEKRKKPAPTLEVAPAESV
jgi:uncharacterized integral membrane protein